jgi:hypothetical protein
MRQFLLVVFILIQLNAVAQERPIHEVYSLMIFNFTKYTQWPDDEIKKQFTISILGNTDVYSYMSSSYGGKILKGDKAIVVNKFESVSELTDSDVIFIDGSESKELQSVLEKVRGKSTLIVTNRAGLAAKGSCINFRVVDGRLRFEVNIKAVESANLKLAKSITSMAILI